jgi:hypothetical protein
VTATDRVTGNSALDKLRLVTYQLVIVQHEPPGGRRRRTGGGVDARARIGREEAIAYMRERGSLTYDPATWRRIVFRRSGRSALGSMLASPRAQRLRGLFAEGIARRAHSPAEGFLESGMPAAAFTRSPGGGAIHGRSDDRG